MQIVLSLLLIIVVPITLIYMLMVIEPFAITHIRFVLLSIGWGVLSFVIADVLQTNEINDLQEYSALAVSLYSAPILEEFLKLSFLLVIYHYTLARYSGDGLVYGFAVGSGFSVMENLAYMLAQPDQAFGISLSRIVTTGLFHACLAGLMGAAVCGVIYYRRWFTYPFFAILFLFSIMGHHFFNLVAYIAYIIEDAPEMILYGIISLLVIIGLQYFIRIRENQRIAHDVPEDLDETEFMLVYHGSDVIGDLEKLGSEQTHILREYLINEAQMALLTHHIIKGKGKRHNIQKLRQELQDLREKAHKLRQSLSPDATNWLDEERKKFAND